MRLDDFEDWLAIRPDHKDDNFWPARLSYSTSDGVSVETTNFSDPSQWYSNSSFERSTITGYLGYNRPATLIAPFVRSYRPGTLRTNSPISVQYQLVANALLLDYFLEDVNSRVFTGLGFELPSFSSWIAHQMVQLQRDNENLGSFVGASFEPTSRRLIQVTSTIQAEITSQLDAGGIVEGRSINQQTYLKYIFSEKQNYDEAMRLGAHTDILFSFIVGLRLDSAVHRLYTDEAVEGTDVKHTANVWPVPGWKRQTIPPHWLRRMFIEPNSPIDLEGMLTICLSCSDENFYFMEMIMNAEGQDLPFEFIFIELLGCFESFDSTNFGSGSDPNIRAARKRLRKIVAEHASDEDLADCDIIGNAFRNQFSLRKRLERLISMWEQDGFKAKPDISRIVELRNFKPHGRGYALSPEMYQEMSYLLSFLCGLGRFHLLKQFGFDRVSRAAGCSRMYNLYGKYVPEDLRPDRPRA